MKTLKTIITTTILLFTLTSTQQAQAQTKEETIQWIEQKLKSYAVREGFEPREDDRVTSVKVSPCYISFTIENFSEYRQVWNSYYYRKYKQEYGISISKISKIQSSNYEGGIIIIEFDSEVVFAKTSYQLKSRTYEDYEDRYNTSYSSFIKIRNGESNLGERMVKALEHLATFCEQKNEAF